MLAFKIIASLLVINAVTARNFGLKMGGISCMNNPCKNGGTCYTPVVIPMTNAPTTMAPYVPPPVCGCQPAFVGNNCQVPITATMRPVTMPATTPCPTFKPVTMPPVTRPPYTMPPVTRPPVTMAPVTTPCPTFKPVTMPPVTRPPVTMAPATTPCAPYTVTRPQPVTMPGYGK